MCNVYALITKPIWRQFVINNMSFLENWVRLVSQRTHSNGVYPFSGKSFRWVRSRVGSRSQRNSFVTAPVTALSMPSVNPTLTGGYAARMEPCTAKVNTT